MQILTRARARAGLTGISAALALMTLAPGLAGAQVSPSLSIADATADEGNEVVFKVTVTGAHPTLTVDYQTRDGSALAGVDYVAASGTLTIQDDQKTGEIRVRTTRERVYEPDETFFVDLSNTIATLADAEGQGTVENDDPVPGISISDASITEIDDLTASVDMQFDVSLTNPASVPVTVRYSTADGTAVGHDPINFQYDFRDTSGQLTFPAGNSQTQHVRVRVRGDLTHEGNETFVVNLSDEANAQLADPQGIGTIIDDDPVPTLSIEAGRVVAEGSSGLRIAELTASLSNPTTVDVTFSVSTSNGTATTPDDYSDVTNSDTITAGQTSTSVLVRVNGDTRFEPSQSFFIIIDSPTGAVLGNSVGELTLTNDDQIIIFDPTLPR